MRLFQMLIAVVFVGCGGSPVPVPGPVAGGSAAGGSAAGGSAAGGPPTAATWTYAAVSGAQCATGAPAGIGYSTGATNELLIFVQGGGACWNNGMCQPSVYQWGPVCNYGMDSFCLADLPGGTKPTAVYVTHPDPFPADGGGAFPIEVGLVRDSVLFARRAENPMRAASFAFIPYCTGGVRSGFVYMVMRWIGLSNPSNYDGSWWDWAAQPALPVEVKG